VLSADPRPLKRRLNGRHPAVAALVCALLAGMAAAESARFGELPARGEVTAIVETLRADPDLQSLRRIKVLHFKHEKPDQQNKSQPPSWWDQWMRWIAEASSWFAATSRWLMWLLGAVAVGLILVSVRRWTKERADVVDLAMPTLPSHVGALDVRPESLPDRIGAHASMLWQRGEQRAALSLLYRGALSRLIHAYSIPIRPAHTESECVRLAQGGLREDLSAFFARLVSIWQLAVYAGRVPATDGVLALCDQFDLLFGQSPIPKGTP
jgi:hypothetical protein